MVGRREKLFEVLNGLDDSRILLNGRHDGLPLFLHLQNVVLGAAFAAAPALPVARRIQRIGRKEEAVGTGPVPATGTRDEGAELGGVGATLARAVEKPTPFELKQ
jgi:hypothetical protein